MSLTVYKIVHNVHDITNSVLYIPLSKEYTNFQH